MMVRYTRQRRPKGGTASNEHGDTRRRRPSPPASRGPCYRRCSVKVLVVTRSPWLVPFIEFPSTAARPPSPGDVHEKVLPLTVPRTGPLSAGVSETVSPVTSDPACRRVIVTVPRRGCDVEPPV